MVVDELTFILIVVIAFFGSLVVSKFLTDFHDYFMWKKRDKAYGTMRRFGDRSIHWFFKTPDWMMNALIKLEGK